MSEVRVDHNEDALYKVRTSARVRADLERRAKNLADKCNQVARTDGFRTSSVLGKRRKPGGGRWRVTVITARRGAIRHNAAHNTLLANLDAARD
jgi:hypothetical protein